MNAIYCRAFQTGMRLANCFMNYRTPELLTGAGSVLRLAANIKARGIGNVLVVAGPTQTKMGRLDGLLAGMEKAGVRYTVFSGVQPNPTDENVEAGLAAYKAGGCRAIVAFGGGSPMDCAKAIGARVAHPGKTVEQLQGLLKVIRGVPPIFAIPTTSGTGSETTIAAVVTIAASHKKAAINDFALIPTLAVLDPALTASMPPRVTAYSGMDALSHAVEAYTNRTYNTKLEDRLAREAVKLIYENLLTAYGNGDDLTARQNMQQASFKAGRAFTRGCVGNVHAIGHTLSALYDLPHGQVMAALLPAVMRQYGSAAYTRLAELADVCGIAGADDRAKALAFLDWVDDMNRRMGIPAGFAEIKETDIPFMIRRAQAEANPLYPVPVVWGDADYEKLIRSVMR